MKDWHTRYAQQAGWTAALRDYLFNKYHLTSQSRFLDVGCGTGALLPEIAGRAPSAHIYGLDISLPALSQSARNAPQASLLCADALQLPFPTGFFDVTFCHFLLLWVKDPLGALTEMRRVTRPGGFVLALAEPDYTQRVEAPQEFAFLGDLQTEALRNQGADIALGGQLAHLLEQAGLNVVESGKLQQAGNQDWDLEWQTLAADLKGALSENEIALYHAKHHRAVADNSRRLHVPTYFACGQVV